MEVEQTGGGEKKERERGKAAKERRIKNDGGEGP